MQHRRLILAGLGLALAFFSLTLLQRCLNEFAWDYAINWTAGYALRSGILIYDQAALRQLGQSQVSPFLRVAFTNPFNSYIGPPSTALLYLPFTFVHYTLALWLYRAATIAAFGAALFLVGRTLPRPSRGAGWLWGALCLLLFDPVNVSIWIGQVDAWVVLALAVSMWAWQHERDWLAGAAAGAAALLKISPAVLIVYFLLKRRYLAALSALLTAGALLGLSAIIGNVANLPRFLSDIAPVLSQGALHTENQSLPAWVARLVLPTTELANYADGLGALRWLGPLAALAGVAAVWYSTRDNDHPQLAIGLLTLVAVLSGPISWDHYASWSVLAIVPIADRRYWDGRSARQRRNLGALLIVGGFLIGVPMFYFTSSAIAAFWWLRLATGTKTLGLLLWFGSGLWLLRASNRRQAAASREPKRAAVRATPAEHEVGIPTA